ncbi:MAG: hypothetical protein WDK96_01075 [Candidatus Paceibacterota bacterium]|jgi:hypothetical protein
MKTKDCFWSIVEFALWVWVTYYFFYMLQNLYEINLIEASFILVISTYFAMMACPWLRKTSAWKELWKKD